MLLEGADFHCPWCDEANWVDFEPGDLGQRVIQDCAVCCRPIQLDLPISGDAADLMVSAEGYD